ncbi:MAG TPA: peptidoglycan DD-metalloendopeptidase family protein [Pyrinomonadaceae bacterium]|nr:peptidoglycan DD-metalloendopeptidase family protein [Pyrinomonadaceae bacterium]
MALGATGRTRLRVLLIVVVTVAGLAVLIWWRTRHPVSGPPTNNVNRNPTATPTVENSPTISATPAAPVIAPSPASQSPEETPPPQIDQASPPPQPLNNNFVGTLKLIIPVAGVKPNQLMDTFADARSEGRVHDAIDIPAPAGTPVLAAADGEIVKLFQSERGGTTIYQLSSDRKLIYYYAHLQRYADNLAVGKFAKQGEVIAYVGDTGNAGAGNFHLHFSISIIADPKRYWEGTNINPYPLLRQ